MKKIVLSYLLSILSLACFGQKENKLYPIRQGVMVGYIDATGKEIVPPTLFRADEFSDGLAVVPIDGKLGYIDATGKTYLPGRYDEAGPFENGMAQVKLNGKLCFINKKGNILFEHSYKEIKAFGSNSFAIVVTASGKYGVINKKGNLIVDTTYKAIDDFQDGLAVVHSFDPTLSEKENKIREAYDFPWGIIDTTGRLVISFNRYRFISQYKNGFAHAHPLIFQNDSPDLAIVDRTGKQRFFIPKKKYSLTYSDGEFHDGLAVVEIYKPGYDADASIPDAANKYAGVINGDGKIIFSDTGWSFITPFANNRAFATTREAKWIMIDSKGKMRSKQFFEDIVFDRNRAGERASPPFQDGTAFVKLGNAYRLIDTNANILETIPDFKDTISPNGIRYQRIGRRLLKLAPYDTVNLYQEYNYHIVGFYNEKTRTTIDVSRFGGIDRSRMGKGLIHAYQGQQTVYINELGEIVWKSLPPDEIPPPLWRKWRDCIDDNIYSGTPASKPINTLPTKAFTPAQGELKAFIDTYQLKGCYWYQSRKLLIVNTLSDTAFFMTIENQLNLLLQAKDKDGIWRDIHKMENPICGRSFKMRALPPGEYWDFCSPVYEGTFKTKIRAKVELLRDRNRDDKLTIYSNEVTDTINPGQFLERQPNTDIH